MKPTIAVVFGTRPEAIKMIPVITALQRNPQLAVITVSTGQHREMLAQVLSRFGIGVDIELELMEPDQTLFRLSSKAITAFEPLFRKFAPSMVLVQGDTTTAFIGALCASYAQVPIGHVEAGLRTKNKSYPFPEEINRRLISTLADLHFAPTNDNRNNLINEGVNPNTIFVTGNTGIDTLVIAAQQNSRFPIPSIDINCKRIITVTIHRRESFGEVMHGIFESVGRIAKKYSDVEIIFPVHLNPKVRTPAHEILDNIGNVHLIDPLDYFDFIQVLKHSYLVLTDSGGIQEEAPTLGVPVLVLRNETERPEAIMAGTVRLAGTNPENILREASNILDNYTEHHRMTAVANPYGDGKSAERIVAYISEFLIKSGHCHN